MMKNKGERGHPCLRPLLHWKNEASRPLTSGDIQGEMTQEAIEQTKLVLKPNLTKTLNIKEFCTQLKELVMSNLITIPFSFAPKLEFIASYTKTLLSIIFWFCMNLPWLSEMNFGINFFKRLAIIFDMILYEELQREMR
jgi:hypothetical protein